MSLVLHTAISSKAKINVSPSISSHLHPRLKSGYDRGHLAPAADHKNSHEAMANTLWVV